MINYTIKKSHLNRNLLFSLTYIRWRNIDWAQFKCQGTEGNDRAKENCVTERKWQVGPQLLNVIQLWIANVPV